MLFNSFMRWRALASQLLFTLVIIIKEGGFCFFVFDGPEDGELCKIHHTLGTPSSLLLGCWNWITHDAIRRCDQLD